MKTLEELVKELGIKQSFEEILCGRNGNFVHIDENNEYVTLSKNFSDISGLVKVIEVKPLVKQHK